MVGIKDFEMPRCCIVCDYWSFNSDDKSLCDLTHDYIQQFDKRHDNCPLVEAIPKDQYEQRLKADIVAMLTDLQLEIEEMTPTHHNPDWSLTDLVSIGKVNEIIQEKIDKLKEESDDYSVGCTRCPYSGHIELKECPDAYTEVSKQCNLYNKSDYYAGK